jgi:VanZ family protein
VTDHNPTDPSVAGSAEQRARPDFLARLGLHWPCRVADVEAAYRAKVSEANLAAGGGGALEQLQTDYHRALELARFQTSRRQWLSATVERYAAQERIIAEVRRRGGSVELASIDWMHREIGEDFAQLLDTVVGIRLTGEKIGSRDVQFLIGHWQTLTALRRLDLSGSRIGNASVQALRIFTGIEELDLSGTLVGDGGGAHLVAMENLRRVGLAHTFVSWLGLLRLRLRRPGLEIVRRVDRDHPVARSKRWYRVVALALLVYLAASFTATHLPAVGRLPTPEWYVPFDKVAHFGMYGALAFLLSWFVALRTPDVEATAHGLWRYLVAWLVIAAYGMADEVTQPAFGRTFDLLDWGADLVGATCGLLAFSAAHLAYRRRAIGSRRGASKSGPNA